MSTNVTPNDSRIDSRDVVERVSEINDEIEALDERTEAIVTREHRAPSPSDDAELFADISAEREELSEELASLNRLLEQIRDYGEDSAEHGVFLIADSDFEDYAREFAEDIGAIDDDARWPATCIDWAQATRELQMDYTAIEWEGVTFYLR